MFRVITVAREYGGGGSVIARRVAEKLRWRLLDQSLIAAVARASQVDAKTVERYDERIDSWWRRFNRAGLWAAAIAAGCAVADAEFFDAETVAGHADRVITDAAAIGECVIVGRGAQCVLRGLEDVLHVFVHGPWRERVSRVRSRVKLCHDVGALIQSTDKRRAAYIRRRYGCDWKDPHLYQLMISSELGIENAVRTIVDAVLRSGHGVIGTAPKLLQSLN
jgi:cytidylate kinase